MGDGMSKVPEVTLTFWITKIAATTLGETGGDAVSMSMQLGYLVGRYSASAALLMFIIACVTLLPQKPASEHH